MELVFIFWGLTAGMFIGFALADHWYRKMLVEHGVAHYDSKTGKWIEHNLPRNEKQHGQI